MTVGVWFPNHLYQEFARTNNMGEIENPNIAKFMVVGIMNLGKGDQTPTVFSHK